jgi:predicted O-linked N-acetylglucosamine transferase (SPINDLY family)
MAVSKNATFERAVAALQAGNAEHAERLFEAVLGAQPAHVAALNMIGIALIQRRKFAEAESYLRRALAQRQNSDATLYNYGIVLKALKRPAEALQRFSEALAINSAVADTWNNRGTAYCDLSCYDRAVEDFNQAIRLNPDHAGAYSNKGRALAALKRHADALSAYRQALAIKPDLAEAWCGCAQVYRRLDRDDQALAAFDRALALQPGLDYAASSRLQAKLHLCDWRNLEAQVAQVLSIVRQQQVACDPGEILTLPSSPADQLASARRYVQNQPRFTPLRHGEVHSHDRIRLGYLSADFHEHATSFLGAGLFEQHDRSRFEVTGISFGPDQNSAMRDRIKSAFDRFVDVESKNEQEVAELVRGLEIDIAIDLNGFATNNRFGILARRPAPIQVNYLGYPGTMAADWIDYVVADAVVIPQQHFEFYSEKIVWLPDSYQVNDNRRPLPQDVPTRRQCGLPDAGFVFCCFNNNYKITPECFSVWMRLLQAVEGSVLWLLETNQTAYANLRQEAEKRGVSSQRLVFARRSSLREHLARHCNADLFLDTLPYNAHTTASDALWAGLPVITCLGTTFAGRVAASLLGATGLSQLITVSLDDYERLALSLAQDRTLLGSIKAKLIDNRNRCPLFDTARFTRDIEDAYARMWQRHRNGTPPASFAVRDAQPRN